jgi:hypothetical protein
VLPRRAGRPHVLDGPGDIRSGLHARGFPLA